MPNSWLRVDPRTRTPPRQTQSSESFPNGMTEDTLQQVVTSMMNIPRHSKFTTGKTPTKQKRSLKQLNTRFNECLFEAASLDAFIEPQPLQKEDLFYTSAVKALDSRPNLVDQALLTCHYPDYKTGLADQRRSLAAIGQVLDAITVINPLITSTRNQIETSWVSQAVSLANGWVDAFSGVWSEVEQGMLSPSRNIDSFDDARETGVFEDTVEAREKRHYILPTVMSSRFLTKTPAFATRVTFSLPQIQSILSAMLPLEKGDSHFRAIDPSKVAFPQIRMFGNAFRALLLREELSYVGKEHELDAFTRTKAYAELMIASVEKAVTDDLEDTTGKFTLDRAKVSLESIRDAFSQLREAASFVWQGIEERNHPSISPEMLGSFYNSKAETFPGSWVGLAKKLGYSGREE